MKPKQESELSGAATLVAPVKGAKSQVETATPSPTTTMEVNSSPEGSPVAASRLATRYELLALLGAGAMGSVYRARDLELDEVVALKMLRPDLLRNPGMLELFRREVKLSRRIAHPNVARVFDIGEHDGRKFLTMELVEGESLSALLEREKRLCILRAVELGLGVCAGLAAAHGAEVVHRDLKPDNVMIVAKDGRPVVMDFGIARAVVSAGDPTATTGTMVGTPAYMAPEQVEAARDIDGRADLYAFGVMLFELLTGALPFDGDTALAVAARRLTHPPPDPRQFRASLPAPLAELVLRCLARRREDRFQSAEQLADALRELSVEAEALSLRSSASGIAGVPRVRTVAVLPLGNTGTSDDDYVASGLTEDLVDNLSTVAGLRLRPLGMASRFAGAEVDPCEAGRQLDVEVVVTGSIRRRGDMLRVTARVVSVADGFQLWAQKFERPVGEALQVSDELTAAVAQTLTVEAEGQARPVVADPVAIDLYLRGRAEATKLGYDALTHALDLLAQSHQRAPQDPKILAAYARTAARRSFFVTDPEEAMRAAELTRELAERVMVLAPDLPESSFVQAYVKFSQGEFADAVRLLKRVIARAPSLVDAQELLGRILVETGPVEAGVAAFDRALALDPSLENVRVERARVLASLGRHEEAERDLWASSQASRPAVMALLGRLIVWGLPVATTREQLQAEFETGPMVGPRMLLGFVLEVMENRVIRAENVELIRSIAAVPARPRRSRVFMLQCLAELQLFVGETDAALQTLEEAMDLGFSDAFWVERCPLLNTVRDLPRFVALRARLEERALEVRRVYEE